MSDLDLTQFSPEEQALIRESVARKAAGEFDEGELGGESPYALDEHWRNGGMNTSATERPEVEASLRGQQMVGPWGARRDFVKKYIDLQKPFVDLADPCNDGPEMEWLIDGFLPLKALAVLGAESKSGKSFFATALALSVATGLPFMGLEVKKRPVLWISFEENAMERQLAFNAWFESGRPRPEPFKFFTSYQPLFIDDPVAMTVIDEWATGLEAGLIVIDPLHAAYSAGSISEGSTARRVLSAVKQLCNRLNLSALVLHHFTKQVGSGVVRERMSDSVQILAAASMDWLMDVQVEKRLVDGTATGGAPPSDPDLRPDHLPPLRRGRDERGDLDGAAEEEYIGAPFIDRGPDGRTVHVFRKLADGTRVDLGPEDEWNAREREKLRARAEPAATREVRVIRLKGSGRGLMVNRTWHIESDGPMEYRLSGEGTVKKGREGRLLEALGTRGLTANQLAMKTGIPAGSVRNLLTKLISTGEVRISAVNGRERVYALAVGLRDEAQ